MKHLFTAGLCTVALTLTAAPAQALQIDDAEATALFNKVFTSSVGVVDKMSPQGGDTVVVFGDSHAAGAAMPLKADERGCTHSMTGWVTQLKNLPAMSSRTVFDGSCHGSGIKTGTNVADQIRYAQSLNALGPNTTDIVIQAGLNDDWSNTNARFFTATFSCLIQNLCGADAIQSGIQSRPEDLTTANYVSALKPITDYLKYYYPQARIHLMGYLEMAPSKDKNICLSVGGHPFEVQRTESLSNYTFMLADAQRGAAHELGLNFIDLAAVSKGHHSCSQHPWVDGFLDPRNNFAGMWPMHPTIESNAITAKIVADLVDQPAG